MIGFVAIFEAQAGAHQLEQLAEFLFGRIEDFDLVGDAAQKGVVDQFLRLQVRGKDDQLIEGDLNLLAAGEIEKIAAFFQRHDPAVEQFVGAHPLPAKIVDDQDAAVAFELHGSLVDAGRRFSVTSRLSIVNSPPTMIVGRRMRTQRRSIFLVFQQARRRFPTALPRGCWDRTGG